jgi:hypothetical protein
MRAAFLADLRHRLSEIEAIADGMCRGAASDDARTALLAQMHDIKGCGTPYGVPEATVLARGYEQRLGEGQLASAAFAELIAELIRDFLQICERNL